MYSNPSERSSSRTAPQANRLLGPVRERIRYPHYSVRTAQAHLVWIRAFIRHHGLRHPRALSTLEVESFLNTLVNPRNVSASTHKQSLCALPFLNREVLDHLESESALVAWVRYGCGLRLTEALIQSETGIRTMQEPLEHSDVGTTMIYTYVLRIAASTVACPFDAVATSPGGPR